MMAALSQDFARSFNTDIEFICVKYFQPTFVTPHFPEFPRSTNTSDPLQ
jgi:hypothetical protein